ncbi:neutral metalloprotease [Staphylococcus agnetis]|uniref:M30 family zinc metallopeptidase n=1 Tax=Staphylococcus agnetis TaxID=985762 RepID=UPI000E06EE14|nr:neutral metalloprotease [Staphylococcus agnetis]SUK15033.1 neutral metalloprotease [Staphylococcus agnetis]
MFKMKKLIMSLVSTSLLATFTLGSFVDAHTYIINNEETNEKVDASSIGTIKQNNFNNNTRKVLRSQDLQSVQEDAELEPPKEKNPITESIRKSKNALSKAKYKEVRTFKTRSYITDEKEKTDEKENTDAKLEYRGKVANVWVADEYITNQQAKKIGEEFEQKIDPLVKDKFGEPSDVDRDGKINILVYDIKDNYDTTKRYTGGYFSPNDLYNNSKSNYAEVLYIDTYPLMGTNKKNLKVERAYKTMAHEYQHLVNANQKLLKERKTKTMDSWLNEGFSLACEQMYTKQPLKNRIRNYNSSTSIPTGHSLIKWKHRDDAISNYALSYLFCQYLIAQSDNGDKIFKEIIQDTAPTNKALEKAIHRHVDPNISLGEFMTNFRIALVMKKATGPYGFNGAPGFNGVTPKLAQEIPSELEPQGSVMIETSSPIEIPKNKGSKIKYVKIK